MSGEKIGTISKHRIRSFAGLIGIEYSKEYNGSLVAECGTNYHKRKITLVPESTERYTVIVECGTYPKSVSMVQIKKLLHQTNNSILTKDDELHEPDSLSRQKVTRKPDLGSWYPDYSKRR